ncbi:MAG: hypothetical protein KJP04_06980 [Arenicella sp.]|nr:hypothetical protein [Arenicella sp.]
MSLEPNIVQQSSLYFTASLTLLSTYVLLYWWRRSYRSSSLISALMSMTTAVYALAFVPEYWNPPQLLKIHPGIEDIIFSFANGGIVWILACHPRQEKMVENQFGTKLFRYLIVSVSFLIILAVLWFAGVPVMISVLASSMVVALYLIKFSYKNMWFAVRGGILFTLMYILGLFTVLTIEPDVINAWNHEKLLGIRLIGIPLEEYLWAFSYGFIWPMFVRFVLFENPIRSGQSSIPPAAKRTKT